jgi:hypothetical protein
MAQKLKFTDKWYNRLIAKLKAIKKKYRALSKGYRSEQYELMARTMTVAETIQSGAASSRFLDEFGDATGKDVVYASMVFMSGAKSDAAKKLAWKRARALSFLVDELNVSIPDIPEAIKKHHGIEALVRLAAQKQPRRGTGQPSDRRARLEEANSNAGHEEDGEDAGENEERAPKVGNARPPYRLGISLKQRSKLKGFPHKTRLKLIGYLRVPSDGALTFEVENIVKLKAATPVDESAASDDWT